MALKWVDVMITKICKEQFRQVYDKCFDAIYTLFDILQQVIRQSGYPS